MIPRLVSVVMVNLNSGSFVDHILSDLSAQTYSPFEVIVVDNGSTDGSISKINAFPFVKLIEVGKNTGFSSALNQGIAVSEGEYVLSMNFDVRLDKDFISELVSGLTKYPDASWAAGAMNRLTKSGVWGPDIDCMGHYWLRSRYCYGNDPSQPQADYYNSVTYVFGASACAALYKREMLLDLSCGGEIFDEDLFAYFEDVDLDWRAQQKGYRCLFVPSARGAHMRGGNNLSNRPSVSALIIANRFLVMLKNDTWSDVLEDFAPIAKRTFQDILFYLRRNPRALPLAAIRFLRKAPAMLRKRRQIKASRSVSAEYIHSLRLKTDFLG